MDDDWDEPVELRSTPIPTPLQGEQVCGLFDDVSCFMLSAFNSGRRDTVCYSFIRKWMEESYTWLEGVQAPFLYAWAIRLYKVRTSFCT